MMAKHKPDQFIVINRKHIEQLLDESNNNTSARITVNKLMIAINMFNGEYYRVFGRRLDNRYYVCNKDEHYAQEVIDVILKGECKKEKSKGA